MGERRAWAGRMRRTTADWAVRNERGLEGRMRRATGMRRGAAMIVFVLLGQRHSRHRHGKHRGNGKPG